MTRLPIVAQPLINKTPLPDFAAGRQRHAALPASCAAQRLVVAFLHGTWCPYCVRQLVRLARAHPALQAADVGLACILRDPVAAIYAYQVSAEPPLHFPLLADGEPSVARLYGVYDPDHESPYPAVFFAGADGLIRYADVSSDPDCYPNMARLLEVVEERARPSA
jgi:peroxiredoxin